MTAQLYLVDIRSLAECEADLLPLTQQRRKLLATLKNPIDRLHCMAAGLLMHHILGIQDDDVAISDQGKPYLCSRNDLHFNLSHSGNYAALIVGTQELGVDIEPIPKCVNTLLARKVFHTDELQWLSDSPTPERFTWLWTRLESSLKAAGSGFDGRERSYSLIDKNCPYCFQTRLFDGHIITIAARKHFSVGFHVLPLKELLSVLSLS